MVGFINRMNRVHAVPAKIVSSFLQMLLGMM